MNKKYPILYKKNEFGKLLIWYIEQEDNKFRTVSGLDDGKKVTSAWTKCNGKNIGKSNETTPEQQATAEIISKYEKKEKQNSYVSDINNVVDKGTKILPMLAKEYEHDSFDFNQRFYSQPKLNGIRCLGTPEGMLSRANNYFVSIPEIEKQVKELLKIYPHIILDGELYNHKFKDNFNKIVSIVKKTKPTIEDLEESKQNIQYHLYDIIVPGTFSTRFPILQHIFNTHLANHPNFVLVNTTEVKDKKHLDDIYVDYIANEYEGQMLRLDDSFYEYKRTKSLLKRKDFKDDEFQIISINEGKGNREGMVGYLELLTHEGKMFKADLKGNRDYLIETLKQKEKYIGKYATVKFFQYTPDGIPLFPKVEIIHETPRV